MPIYTALIKCILCYMLHTINYITYIYIYMSFAGRPDMIHAGHLGVFECSMTTSQEELELALVVARPTIQVLAAVRVGHVI